MNNDPWAAFPDAPALPQPQTGQGDPWAAFPDAPSPKPVSASYDQITQGVEGGAQARLDAYRDVLRQAQKEGGYTVERSQDGLIRTTTPNEPLKQGEIRFEPGNKTSMLGSDGSTVSMVGKQGATGADRSAELAALDLRAQEGRDSSVLKAIPAAQGMAFNFTDEAAGGLSAGLEALAGGSRPGYSYDVMKAAINQEQAQQRSEAPWQTAGLELAGGLATALAAAPASAVKGGASLASGLVSGAKQGAAFGGLYGLGAGDGVEDRLSQAATGAAVGGLLGGALGGAGGYFAGRTPAASQAIEAADRLGIQLPRAIATESKAVQQIANAEANMPFAGPILSRSIDRSKQQLGEAADRVAAGLGATERQAAGTTARDAIENAWTKTESDKIASLYDDVGKLVNPTVVTPLESTGGVVSEILASRAAQRVSDPGKAVSFVADAVKDPNGLTYEGIKGLRTRVGEMLKNTNALENQGVNVSELNRIYGSLSDDLQRAVTASGGPEAQAAFQAANTASREFAQAKEALAPLARTQSDEKLFDTIFSMASSGARADIQRLAQTRKAMGPEAWENTVGTYVAKLGRDAEGNFSPERFVTDWGKLSDGAKNVLFRSTGKKELAQSLDDIATVSSKFKEAGRYANPSGTAQATATQNVLKGGTLSYGAFVDPVTALAVTAGNMSLAKILASPASARAASRWSQIALATAKNGSKASHNALQVASRRFASEIGKDLGITIDPARLYQGVIGRAPANAEQQ